MSLLDTASLIVTPNGYKEGKLYSVIPSDGSGDMSVVRATTATRVNSAGLVELVPYNLLTYSEDFNNAAWISGEITLASGQSSPLGTNTAFKITGASATNAFLLQVGIPVTSGNTYTASVYLKGSTSGSVSLRVDSGSTAPNNPVSYTNEWQRFTYTFTAGSTTATAILGGYNTWTGSEEIFVYGFQLVEGSVAKDYQKTETRLNIPRLDYSNGTCPSLLVEPQRSNVTLQSENLSTTWYTAGGLLTTNATTSPSGILNADKIKADTSNGIHVYQQTLAVSASTVYTMSVFVKSSELTFLELADASSLKGQTFNLTAQTILAPQTGGFSPTTSSKIEDYGNGWLKCSITYTTLSIVSFFRISLSNGSTTSFTGNNTDGLFVWGAQLEAGSYPTSYIPTTSASVTRNADVISKTGISSLIGQTEGTLFWDVDFEVVANNDAIFIKENATFDTFVFMQKESSGIIACGYYGSGALQARIESSPVTVGRYKIAFAYKNNDFVMYLNGTQVGTDTSGTVSGLMDYFDLHWTESGCNNAYASALLKTRLTNSQLAQLTTI